MNTIQTVIEFLGTFAFAISGIRLSAFKKFDWFGGYVVGLATAIGGGTIRDVMLGITPFWMTDSIYIVCTGLALAIVIIFKKAIAKFNNAYFLFDTLGLALFTIAGIQKTVIAGLPFWVAIIIGNNTGVAGGIIRDVLINEVPLIFRKEIYAMASIVGGIAYYICMQLHSNVEICALVGFGIVVVARLLAVKYHVSLPQLPNATEEQ